MKDLKKQALAFLSFLYQIFKAGQPINTTILGKNIFEIR
jgi:hypothetical protein